MTKESSGTVLAAGAIVWRRTDSGTLELLLVHSARWDEWSWPKGKLRKGESLAMCAVREVREETGVRVEPGLRLPGRAYVLPDGRPKEVTYWAGRVRSSGPATAPDTEIAEAAWLPAEEALERLTHPDDRVPGQALLALADDNALETAPLIVVRHAKARSRANWDGSEADRPLTHTGARQALALAGVLGVWAPRRMLSSPWLRCTETLRPYLKPETGSAEGERGTPEILPLLSEAGAEQDPDRVDALIAGLLDAGSSVLVCTHRPVLAEIVATLAEASSVAVRDHLPHRDPWLSPAEVLVAHVADARNEGGRRRIVAIERHSPRSL